MFKFQEKIFLHQIKNGSEQAFAALYDTYRNKIYRFIYFKVSDGEKAQELANEVFLKVYDYTKEGREIDNFQAFIYKIARNLIIDFYRSKRDEVSIEEAPEIISSTDTVEEIDQKMAMDKVKKYLALLNSEYQEPVRLHYFEGLSFKEIAEIIGESEVNARMRAHRGIKQLKQLLNTPS